MQLLLGQDSLLLKHYPILADYFLMQSFLYKVLEQYSLELKLPPSLFKFLNKFYSTSIAEKSLSINQILSSKKSWFISQLKSKDSR